MIKLFDYQENALKKIGNKGFLGMDTGLGKTYTSLVWAKRYDNPVLILVKPQKINDWENAIKEIWPDKTDYIIITYGKFIRISNTKELFNNYTLIFDESQKLINPTSKISKKTRFVTWSNVLLLSATLISKGYEDYAVQLNILTGLPIKDFKNTFLNIKKVNYGFGAVDKIVGYKNVKELINILKNLGTFITKKETEIREDIIWIDDYDPDAAFFRIAKDFYLDNYICANAGVTFMAQRQLSSGVLNDKIYNDEKVLALQKLIDELDGNIIVFYNYNSEKNQILNTVKNRNLLQINGDKNELDIIGENDVILIHYQSGAEALDGLQFKTNKMIFYSPPLSANLFTQAKGRIDRIGQNKGWIEYYYLISSLGLEKDIYLKLVNKQDYQKKVFKHE